MDSDKTVNAINKWRKMVQCNCGGKLNKWNNISDNTFHVMCAKPKYECDLKAKKWTKPSVRRRSCGYHKIFKGGKSHEFSEKISLKEELPPKKYKFKAHTLEEDLRQKFKYLLLSGHSGTLQQIDIIVKQKLKREPRRKYYNGQHNAFLYDEEDIEVYYKRIFSQKIIDKSSKSSSKVRSLPNSGNVNDKPFTQLKSECHIGPGPWPRPCTKEDIDIASTMESYMGTKC